MKIKFVPQNVEFEIKPNESVLKVAQDNGLHIKSVCKGVPSCAECMVKVVDGDYNVFKPTPAEVNLIGSAYFVDRRRLSCQLKCFGDVTIDLADQIEKANRIVTKKPRGGRQAVAGEDFDPGASSAVRGSIMFEGGDPMADIENVDPELEPPPKPVRPVLPDKAANPQGQKSSKPGTKPVWTPKPK